MASSCHRTGTFRVTAEDHALETYQSKRDFSRTAEPRGGTVAANGHGSRFVIQEHHATALHWDFRLERDGVLVSWAVPKGLPPHPKQNGLAVHTEDHPMEYLDFEGDISQGEYGGGKVILWDRGTYECEKWEDDEIIVVLHGSRVQGRYALIRTGGKNWLVHRMDPPADPDRQLMPETFALPPRETGPMPADQDAWSFEAAWGGRRVVVASQGGRLRDMNLYPELSAMGRAIGSVEVALEGELVASEDVFSRRENARGASALRRLAQREPVTFMATDVLWWEGHSVGEQPFRERRPQLESLALEGPNWRTSPSHVGDGDALLAAVRAQGPPGVVARPLDGPITAVRFIPA